MSNLSNVLTFMGYAFDSDFICHGPEGAQRFDWIGAGQAPTQAEIDSVAASQAFLDWQAEHGGDPVLTLRRQAREALAAQRGEDMRTRAALIEIVKELNRHADHHNAIVSAITGASNFAQVQSALTALGDYPQRTPAQLQALVSAAIDAGEAD